jgi:hypothetical protein
MEVNTTTTTDPINMYGYLNSLVLNPVIFIIIFIIIVIYVVIFYSLGDSQQQSDSNASSGYQRILGIIIVAVLIVLLILNVFQYFFSINITAYLKNIFTNKPEVDIVVDQSTYQPAPVPEIKFRKQVFNIPGNYYTYDNAKALCNAYGAKLATYQQIENAYKNGGEWCNYGWSDEQMALFPTQQNTYNHLQTIKGHEHDCGRPGINGGYMANPNLKFGVNCYGDKPRITQTEEEIMNTIPPYPQTAQDIALQKKVDYWKNHVTDILVSPFNHNMWSEL